VFMRRDKAHEVLKVHKRANYFLEEIRPGNLERECNKEKCSFEEAREIFHSQEKTVSLHSWDYTMPCFLFVGSNPCRTNPCENGGVCKIRHYRYICICPPRFGGENCEQVCVSPAEEPRCWYKNGGCWHFCSDGDGSSSRPACSCAPGYALQSNRKRCLQAGKARPQQTSLPPHRRAPTSKQNSSRITGGPLCHHGHCPWQVTLVLIRNSKGIGFCGGSLSSSRWVVTAAHCLDLVRPHHVTLGKCKWYQGVVSTVRGLRHMERSWTHPHYDPNDYSGDIALLYLSSAVTFNEFTLPICLPSPGLATLLSAEGWVGTVSGWGATHYGGSTLCFLMKVRLPIVAMETCQQATKRLVTDNMFCAGHHTAAADACKGDSRGPFAVSYHNTWFLLGIISWGEGCAQEGKYGVYTRVANYISWIKEVVE
ncbi:FAXD protein, partial [Turnix velox]|nr:FAXD protein [Turnix velox]